MVSSEPVSWFNSCFLVFSGDSTSQGEERWSALTVSKDHSLPHLILWNVLNCVASDSSNLEYIHNYWKLISDYMMTTPGHSGSVLTYSSAFCCHSLLFSCLDVVLFLFFFFYFTIMREKKIGIIYNWSWDKSILLLYLYM